MSSNKQKPSVSYTLFLHRQELRRSEVLYLSLSKTKFLLTDELISQGLHNLKKCHSIDVKSITRELWFKKKLKKQIHRIYKLENLGIKNANPNDQSTEL